MDHDRAHESADHDDHPILFIPGPVEVDRELREIMAMPLIGHRSEVAKDCIVEVCARLRGLFLTEQHAFFDNAPATALMEAGIRNLVRGRVLHLTCGAFSERWATISEACARQPQTLAVDWGRTIAPDRLREALERASEPFEAVCMTHSETSTGALNPIAELAAVVREVSPETLILVDAVTSLAGAELRFDEWGLDLAFAGTQKCLALPPGLVAFAASERAIDKAKTVEGRGYWLDLAASPERFETGATPATPNVPLVFALRRQLERIEAEGLERRWARHAELRDATVAWGDEHGLAPFVAAPQDRSPTVTTLQLGELDAGALVAAAKAAGFTLAAGYGKLKGETFRVGHMGDHDRARLERLLAAIAP